MFITALGTAVPPRSFSQRDCWEALQRVSHPALTGRTRAVLNGILTHDNGIDRRSLALDSIEESFELDPDTLYRRFEREAPALANAAARDALAHAGIDARSIDAVVISTCTGYLCPGLTSYAVESLGLRSDVVAFDLVGQGCGAALPNLRAGEALVASGAGNVLCVCVEVCSAAMYIDTDLGVLVSACLFGDGAGAAVVARDPAAEGRRVEWKSSVSMMRPDQRDALRFEQRGGMLRNILTLPVPKLAGRHARDVLDRGLASAGVERSAISSWILHAGGRKVLEELQSSMALDDADLLHSREMLRRYGNLSSPFVLFVLDAALRADAPPGKWWMSSFGAGFSCHGALLEVA
ncbi:MAG TPA: 3-oxoacyl-[acyl-carrier-protein] synthase III C-terminal domain-containing protein [Usitatibacter sp.]|jgi:alkylresorcinol/alkylpyrone synthase|nr:3-oxoacyl-[acyl-carrier-protein] synthase III C-terminal domain-containing protein [Usitatibacter sp.]